MNDLILTLETNAMEHWRRGDPMQWAKISREDVIYIDPYQTQPVVGLENYTRFLLALTGQIHYEVSEFIDPKVVEMENVALLSYNYRSLRVPGSQIPANENLWNTTEVYFHENGEWKIVHSHWSYVHHRAPAQVVVPVPVGSAPIGYDGILGELMSLESAAMEKWRKGNPWGFIELSDPETTYFDTGTPSRINGRDALCAEYALREGKVHYDVMEFIDPQVRLMGDVAVLVYRFFSTVLNPDGTVASRVPWNCTEVFRRKEGSWKIIHTHWSIIGGEKINPS